MMAYKNTFKHTLTPGMTSYYVTHYIYPRAALVILKSHPYDHIAHIRHILYHHAQEITLTCLGLIYVMRKHCYDSPD